MYKSQVKETLFGLTNPIIQQKLVQTGEKKKSLLPLFAIANHTSENT